MKKLLVLCLAFVMMLSFVGCKSEEEKALDNLKDGLEDALEGVDDKASDALDQAKDLLDQLS